MDPSRVALWGIVGFATWGLGFRAWGLGFGSLRCRFDVLRQYSRYLQS